MLRDALLRSAPQHVGSIRSHDNSTRTAHSDLILKRSYVLACDRLEGWPHALDSPPSFETHCDRQAATAMLLMRSESSSRSASPQRFTNSQLEVPPTASALPQRSDADLAGELVELGDELARHRHAVREPVGAPGAALFARQPHLVEARQRLRGAQVAQVAVDVALERVERREAGDVERDDEVPGVADVGVVEVEVEHVAAEGGAVERPGEEPEHEREAASLVTADRQQHALAALCRVGQRLGVLGVA